MNPITFYRGPSAPHARLASYWLARLAEWQRTGGRNSRKGRALCLANFTRNNDAAKASL